MKIKELIENKKEEEFFSELKADGDTYYITIDPEDEDYQISIDKYDENIVLCNLEEWEKIKENFDILIEKVVR